MPPCELSTPGITHSSIARFLGSMHRDGFLLVRCWLKPALSFRPLACPRVCAEAGRCNAIVFWYELHMGSAVPQITSAPLAAAAPGANRIGVGQALVFLPPKDVEASADGLTPPPSSARPPRGRRASAARPPLM